ncbi:hypothetical protein Vafri_8302 [Volvox africanus]|nr:hypothetical protein Vafri_8302 [Volvox africanus]
MWSIGCILIELITGEALFQTHENLEHLAMMEAVLGPVPSTMSCKCARTPAGKYFNGIGRLNWPDGASRKSIKAVKRLSGLHQLILEQGDTSARPYATELVDLIGSMLRYEPTDRLTAHQALAHPFFATPCVATQGASRHQQQQQGPLVAGLAAAAAASVPRSVPAAAAVAASLGAGALGSTGATASSAPLPPAVV